MPDNTNTPEQHEIRGITADNIQLPEPTPEPSQEGK